MVDKSIAYRLSFFISIAVIVVFIAIIVVYFVLNQRLIRENIGYKAVGLSTEVSSVINREIISIKKLSANLAEQANYYKNNNDIEELLNQVTNKYPYLTSVYVYFDTARISPYSFYRIVRKDSLFEFERFELPYFACQSELENFQEAQTSSFSGWTAPYFCGENKEAVVSYIYPMISKTGADEIEGHVSSNLSLIELNRIINNIKADDKGFAFIVDIQGNYITHPNENKIINSNLFSSSSTLNQNNYNDDKIFAGGKSGQVIAYPETFDYEKSWVYFSPLPETRWYLMYVIPYRELYGELFKIIFLMSLFALFGIGLIFLLVSFIIRKQIEPLSNLTSRLTLFSSPFKLNTKNEIKQVANSLEYLKIWFEQYQIAREKDVMNNNLHKQDLQQASEIQQSLIKTTFPAYPDRNDIDIYAVYKPAQVVSGDLFDYYFIDENHLMFTTGDVSGKGIPAAIFMSVCQTVIKNNSHFKLPGKIVEITNTELYTSNHHQYFLTLFVGILNVKTGELNFCNAAHTFPLIIKSNGDVIEIKSTHGLPLGLYPEKEYLDESIVLEPGDIVLLYTDGVFDALNETNITSGGRWLKSKLRNMKTNTPKEVLNIIESELEKKEITYRDDISMLGIKYQKNSLV